MITVQKFIPAHNKQGSAYGAMLEAELRAWAGSVVASKLLDDAEPLAYKKPTYVRDEILRMADEVKGNMGSKSLHAPVFTIAIMENRRIGAICKRGNGGAINRHSISFIVSRPASMRNGYWPSPSPTSVLFAEAALVAQNGGGKLTLLTENDDLITMYHDAYRFEVSGPTDSFLHTPMALSTENQNWLVNKYAMGAAWVYERPLPAPPVVG